MVLAGLQPHCLGFWDTLQDAADRPPPDIELPVDIPNAEPLQAELPLYRDSKTSRGRCGGKFQNDLHVLPHAAGGQVRKVATAPGFKETEPLRRPPTHSAMTPADLSV